MHIICSHSTPRNRPSRSPSHSILCTAKNQLVSIIEGRHIIMSNISQTFCCNQTNAVYGMYQLIHAQWSQIFYSYQHPSHSYTLTKTQDTSVGSHPHPGMKWWQKHMRKSVDFLTPPNHSVAVTGIPNVKQKVVRDELGSERSFECKGEPKEPRGIHPSFQGALWSAL